MQVLQAACDHGARYLGFVFVPQYPRYVAADTAKELSWQVPTGVKTVGLFSDPTDEDLARVLPYVMLDMIQLHGHETPQRVAEIKQQTGMPIIKALPIHKATDFSAAQNYLGCADMILWDAKAEDAAPNTANYGGTGKSFDWQMLKDAATTFPPIPWLLAGGLSADNAHAALDICMGLPQFQGLDISSGVEAEKGIKDPDLIANFLQLVKEYHHDQK